MGHCSADAAPCSAPPFGTRLECASPSVPPPSGTAATTASGRSVARMRACRKSTTAPAAS
eukprot:4597639-Lingulodinium_polyedra.AAC.1